MQPEPGWPETRLLGADFGRYTVSCTTYCFPTALVPYFRSSLIWSSLLFSCASSQRRVRSVAEWREAELALVHDAYRQDHAPRAEEVAEKKRDAPPQGFWSLKVAQN